MSYSKAKFDEAKRAIRTVHADTSVTLETVLDRLEELAALAEELADAVREDIAGGAGE